MKLEDYLRMENRYQMLTKSHPDLAKVLWKKAQEDVNARWKTYQRMAASDENGTQTDGSP
jgi:pyruvate-ferredoxin/flavodoxin oxidoreductase